MTEFHIRTSGASEVTVTTDDPLIERELDGIFFRVRVDGEWSNRCMTDLPEEIVACLLCENARGADDPVTYMMSAVRHLHERLRSVGDQLDLSRA